MLQIGQTKTIHVPPRAKTPPEFVNRSGDGDSRQSLLSSTCDSDDNQSGIVPYEPLLDKNSRRARSRTLFPIVHKDIWEFHQKLAAAHWDLPEIDMGRDKSDYMSKLTDDERSVLNMGVASFISIDNLVNENLSDNFINEVAYPEAKAFFARQIGNEQVHAVTYSSWNEDIIPEKKLRDEINQAYLDPDDMTPELAKRYTNIRAKRDWMLKWRNQDISFAERLFAAACAEGLFFQPLILFVFYLRKNGKLPGLAQATEMINRDEQLHRDFYLLLLRDHIVNKPSISRIQEILAQAVYTERAFAVDLLGKNQLPGLTLDQMQNYTATCANNLMQVGAYLAIYDPLPPPSYAEITSLVGMTNFHEKRVTDYKMHSKTSQDSLEENDNTLDCDNYDDI